MKKKLLAAVIMSLAMAAPQVKAEPSALEQALNDPNVEKFLLPSDQSISADLPITSERLFELNDFDTPTGDNYYNIIGNGHSGFGDNSHGVYDLTNVQSISGFNTKASASNPNGDGGAFFLDDDSCLVVLSNNFDAEKKPLMTTIANNTAAGKGGAIYANYNWGGGVYLANTNVIDNVAGDKGGGLYLDWGINKIVALPGTNVVIADNKAVIGGQLVDNDIYLYSPRKQQNSGGIRGTLSLVTSSTVEDPTSSVPTGTGRIYVGDLRAEGSSDVIIGSSSHENTAIGQVMIENLILDNDAMFSTQKVSPDSKTGIYIPELTMSRDSIINTVNGYIDDNLHIIDISLDNSNNKFMVDASLMNGNTVIDHFGTISGGTGKLLVNIIGSDTTSGMVRLSSGTTSTATFADSTTQYGGLKYTFTQDEDDKGIFHYTTTKDRSVTLQEALKDYTLAEYDMPDLTVADEDLGPMYHYNPDTGEFVERTFTINGNGGILITDGQEHSGISIPTQLYPPEDDKLTPKLIVNDLELVSGFTAKASNYDSFAQGGAIRADDAVLELHNVTFSDNIATGAGTAVSNSTFGLGGAVHLATRDGYEQIWDEEQQAWIDGDHFKSIIENSTFINNKAISTKGSSGGYGGIVDGGGAVYAKGDLDITGSLFADNVAISAINEGTAEGGALFVANNSELAGMNGTVNISDTMFMSNVAGDVINEGDALTNTCAYGGALISYRADVNISDSQFVDNIARAAEFTNDYGYTVKGEAQGGAIHIDKMIAGSNVINIDGSTFALNKTEVVKSVDNGDGTYTLTSDGVDQYKSMGGAIAIMPYTGSYDKVSVNITNSDFIANESGNGGAIYNKGSELNIKNSSFSGNQSTYYCFDTPTTYESDMNGGAIFNATGAILNLDGVKFSSNYAEQITYDGETPIVTTVKNDIRNDAGASGGLYFIGNASELDGGIVGTGYTHFNLGLDKFGNVDPNATNTTMTIGENTSIVQTLIDVNAGTVNIVNADNITSRAGFTVGENGTLNIMSGTMTISNKYNREIENSGNLYNGGTLDLTGAQYAKSVTNNETGMFVNAGSVLAGTLNNSGIYYNNGITEAAIVNAAEGTFANNGSITGDFENSGLLANFADGSITTTAVLQNNADATIINAGSIYTDTFTNVGTLINGVNPSNPEELVTTALILGDVVNNATAYNAGVITGSNLNNDGGTFQNDGLILSTVLNQNGGEFTNDAIMGGDVENAANSTFTNNSGLAGSLDNYGTFINSAGAELDSTIMGTDSVVNRGGATFTNDGTLTSSAISNYGEFTNNADIEGNVTNTMGDFINAGSITGNITNTAGDFANIGFITGNFTNNFVGEVINGGVIAGDVNNGSDFTNAGIITGDVANDDDFENYGVIAGDLDNGGDFLNNGTIDGDVDNSGTLISKLDDIGGTVDMSWSSAEFEILNNGITFDETNKSKIQGNSGTLSLYGDIVSNAVLDFTGDIDLNGGARIIKAENGDAFQSASGININNSVTATISSLNGTGDELNYGTKINTASGSTLRLEMDWNDSITADGSRIAGDVQLKTIDLTNVADGAITTLINDSIGSKILTDLPDIDIITSQGSANSVSYVYTPATATAPGYGTLTATRIPNLAAVINTSAVNNDEDLYYNYAMSNNEVGSTTNIIGHLKVNGAGHTIESKGLVIGKNDGSETSDVILRDTNISNVNTTGNGALSVNIGSHLTIRADENDVGVSGTSGANKNAVHLAGTLGDALATVTLEANNGKTITINDDIVSTNRMNKIFFNNGKIDMNGVIDPITAVNTGADVTRGGADTSVTWQLFGGTLKYLNDSYLNDNTNDVEFKGGTLDLMNGAATTIALNNLQLDATSNMYVDADLAAGAMDKFNPLVTTVNGGTLNVAGINLLSDANADKTTINFTNDATLMGSVNYTGSTALSRIFKYNVGYDPTTGDFDFTRMAGGGYKDYNPGTLAAPIAAQLGGYLTQLNSYDQAFMNMDTYMMMPSSVRTALKMRNKIASLENAQYDDTKTMYDYAGGWLRPYATFENVHLHNGPRVSNVMYGSFFGGESPLYDLGHGWDGMWGAYVGYNGSHQAYDGVGIYQNGGTLGLTGMAYKDNFFVGGTINVGANAGEASTAFGQDDFAMIMSGAAVKAGYNWELADGKFIIQPSLQTSYSFVNTFDYTNAAGVRMDSDPLHAITIEPGIKFIGNLKNGWQPYAGISMVFNIMDRTRFQANDVSLPNFSINPFVRYGVGVRKTWGERLTGHFQTYFTNGGRNGIGLSAGLRWAIGKEGTGEIKGQTPELKPTKITLNNHK